MLSRASVTMKPITSKNLRREADVRFQHAEMHLSRFVHKLLHQPRSDAPPLERGVHIEVVHEAIRIHLRHSGDVFIHESNERIFFRQPLPPFIHVLILKPSQG